MVIRNSIWNMLGVLLPAALTFPMMGYISREISIDEFAIFIFLFSLAGITTIFDFGFSRAITREIAVSNKSKYAINQITISSAPPLIILLVLTWLFFIFFSPVISELVNINSYDLNKKISAFRIFACMTPLIILNQFLIGILEGLSKFDQLSLQRILGASFIAILPALAVFFDKDLISALYGLLIGRLLYLFITFISLVNILIFSYKLFDKKLCLQISKYAFILSAGNFVNTGVAQCDKLIVASKVGAGGLASYGTVSELLGKLTLIASSVSRAIFPMLSSKDQRQHDLAYGLAQNFISCVAALITLGIFWKADLILSVWLGNRIADMATPILKIMSIGFFFNSLAQIPFTKLQAQGMAYLTTRLHVIECFPYLVGLLWASGRWGITGAATCWSIRTAFDWILLLFLSKRELN